MQHYAAFHLGLHCLQKYSFRGKILEYKGLSYKLACAYSKDANHSAHLGSLIRFSVPPEETLDLSLPIELLSETLIRLPRCIG